MSSEASDGDSFGLEDVDKQIRINELAEQARERGMEFHRVEDGTPPEVEEEFLRSVIRYEDAPVGSFFARLEAHGVSLPAPDSLDDAALHETLWEVVRALAAFDAFLFHTDHLSDRELYEELWKDTLREEYAMFPPGSGWRCSIDLISGGSERDIEIGLRYYDSEEERASWLEDFPETVMPAREKPPYDRDRLLPHAPDW